MYLFSFRSRTQSMKFYDLLLKTDISAKIINTPRDISSGCGLSVAIEPNRVEQAKKALENTHFDSFIGLFYYKNGI